MVRTDIAEPGTFAGTEALTLTFGAAVTGRADSVVVGAVVTKRTDFAVVGAAATVGRTAGVDDSLLELTAPPRVAVGFGGDATTFLHSGRIAVPNATGVAFVVGGGAATGRGRVRVIAPLGSFPLRKSEAFVGRRYPGRAGTEADCKLLPRP